MLVGFGINKNRVTLPGANLGEIITCVCLYHMSG